MSKEIYISTTPHETRLAIVEDEQLTEIYYERENEYTLAGSIYNGKVTRVLPGMQSSFVDIGLERDAFLYVTDFMEEQGDAADFDSEGGSRSGRQRSEGGEGREQGSREQGGRDGGRGRGRRDRGPRPVAAGDQDTDSTVSFDEPIAPAPTEGPGSEDASEEGGSRRWRGRRGRRRGRSGREGVPQTEAVAGTQTNDTFVEEGGYVDDMDAAAPEPRYEAGSIEIDLQGEAAPAMEERPRNGGERGGRDRGRDRGRERGGRDRGGDRGGSRAGREDRSASRGAADRPAFDNSYAGYYNEEALPESTGEPIVLPGESIRKYRDPAELAAEEEEARRNAPPKPEVLTVSAPSIEIVGWDGGAVLPGETLSRRRKPEPKRSAEPVTLPEAAAGQDEIAAEPEAAVEPEPTGSSVEEAAVIADLGALPGAMLPEEVVAEPETASEYEPEEGASARTADSDRRDLRWFSREPEVKPEISAEAEAIIEAETEAIAQAEPAEEPAAPDATAYDLNASADAKDAAELNSVEQAEDVAAPIAERAAEDASGAEFTTLQPTGEMLSVVVEADDAGVMPIAVQDVPDSTVAHEGAVQGVTLADAETVPLAVSGDDAAVAEIHAYGEGDFHEEEIDEFEEDFEYEAAVSGSEDGESEEYEEETLDGSGDMASMLHDMAGDRESGAEDEFEESAAGGFTEEDFGGEPSDEEPEAATGNGSAEPRRREGGFRRGGSGGGRDRRGGRNSGGDRGRGGRRQSMQTTDMPAINELLKPGQEILVQIAKEPIAKKGARITSHIALPGRFLVFMPTVNHTGVSRKISSDEERRRLKSILLSEKGDAQGGFIVRTAADGASEEELRTDLRFLIQMWQDIKQRSETSKSPALIYHDLNLVERILRDQVTDNFSAIWVDTEQEYERVLRFLQRFQPSLIRRVKLYTKETPIFEHFGVTQEIDKALKSKVWLKSGGSIVINQTEALVAIDINTGKYVGKTARLEDTIVKTNLDAIPEIVRQIRLRDLGGIIVIDFIDMDERKNRAKVLQALEDAMRADRAPSKILPFNDFGLVIMTRKRVKQSLERTLCMPDPVTEGTGMIKSPVTIANEIYVEMKKMKRHLEKPDVLLRVHPEVVKTLKANGGKRLQELEEMTRKTILVKSDPALSPEAFDIH